MRGRKVGKRSGGEARGTLDRTTGRSRKLEESLWQPRNQLARFNPGGYGVPWPP